MSHAVDPDTLDEAVAPYNSTPFVLYSSDGGSTRVNHVVVNSISGNLVEIRGFGRGIAKRITGAPDTPLSLLWPAANPGDFSLIADGTGTLSSAEVITIDVSAAVLHRPAPVDGPASC